MLMLFWGIFMEVLYINMSQWPGENTGSYLAARKVRESREKFMSRAESS
jgi:hypothetical protein